MEDCIFCKIVKGDINSAKVYEDEDFFGFLDHKPVAKGHILLIPKVHRKWMTEAEDKLISKIFILSKKMMNLMILNIPCDYVQVSVIGEAVPHFHVHLIPRYVNDGIVGWKTKEYNSQSEIQEYMNKIKN